MARARSTSSGGFAKTRRVLLAVGIVCLMPGFAPAQDFAGKMIRISVGAPPGGALDLVARIIAPGLGEELKATVVVENKPGASGVVNSEYVSKSAPDGRTLLVGSATPIVVAPQTMPQMGFNSITDLTAINSTGVTAQAIAVNTKLGVTTLKEILELSKTRQIALASNGYGGLPHLTIELLAQASKGNILHVPYKGAGPAINDTLGGHVDGVVMDVSALYPQIEQGALVALAVTSEKADPFLPKVPTANEQLPGFTVMNWQGLFAARNTPKPIVDALNAALVKVVAREDVRAQLLKGAIIPTTMASPEAFQQFLAQEYERWGKVVKEKNIVAKE